MLDGLIIGNIALSERQPELIREVLFARSQRENPPPPMEKARRVSSLLGQKIFKYCEDLVSLYGEKPLFSLRSRRLDVKLDVESQAPISVYIWLTKPSVDWLPKEVTIEIPEISDKRGKIVLHEDGTGEMTFKRGESGMRASLETMRAFDEVVNLIRQQYPISPPVSTP